jgi:hypothetical protein
VECLEDHGSAPAVARAISTQLNACRSDLSPLDLLIETYTLERRRLQMKKLSIEGLKKAHEGR